MFASATTVHSMEISLPLNVNLIVVGQLHVSHIFLN